MPRQSAPLANDPLPPPQTTPYAIDIRVRGLEADAIVEMSDGRWAAFEVKLGQREVDDAAAHLIRLRGRVNTDAAGDPVVLVVVTATGYGYRRKDGVAVVPIGALTL